MVVLQANIKSIIKQEYVSLVFDRLIGNGSKPIEDMKDIIRNLPTEYPSTSKAREVMSALIQFYTDLSDAWQALLDKD